MAGGGSESDEDPVPVNCVALIDIIFCLCLFFMCAFHFHQLQGKMDAALPKGAGNRTNSVTPFLLDDVRVSIRREADGRVAMRVGTRAVASKDELRALIRESKVEASAAGRRLPVILDAAPEVPWRHALAALDACRLEDEAGSTIDVEFAAPALAPGSM